MRLCASVLALAVLAPLSAFAQEPPPGAPPAAPPPGAPPAEAPPAAAPAPAPVVAAAPAAEPAKTWKDLITIEGLVDSYYQFNFSGKGNNSSLVPPQYQRSFDQNSNAFTLSYAKIGVGMTSDNVGFRLDMGYGATGNVVNGFPAAGVPTMVGGAGSPAVTLGSAFLVQQAFASLTPVNNLTIDFGKFVTTAGAEVIEANKNWLYSRSLLFFNIPLLHTGVRASYKVNDMVSVQAGVVNGWNGQGFEVAPAAAKTYEVNASFMLPMGVGIIPTIYVGNTGSGSTRFLGDLVATYTLGNLGLNLNFDYVHDKNALIDPYIGVSVMGHYVVSEHLNVTARFEYEQQKGVSGGPTQKNEEVTVGCALPFAGHYELRPEIRADFGSPSNFNESIDPTVMNVKGNQVTGTVAALAYF